MAIVAAAGLALVYLTQSTHVAATGYEIDQLQAQLAERRAEQEQLVLQIGRAQSPAEIEARARDRLGLVLIEPDAIQFAPRPTD